MPYTKGTFTSITTHGASIPDITNIGCWQVNIYMFQFELKLKIYCSQNICYTLQ